MKLYVYDHCPFCVKAREIFGLKGLPFELVVMANDDAATPERMVGRKVAPMPNPSVNNDQISSKVEIAYPDFETLPEAVRAKFESLSTKVNFFKMLGHSVGTFIPVIDLTNAIFRDLTLSDYHKELIVLLVGAHGSVAYEWEQHVSIAQAAGVRPDQFIAIAEDRLDDTEAFSEGERVLLRFGKAILVQGMAPGVLFKHALRHFSVQELSDAIIVLGYYRMIAGFIQTFNLAIDAQEDGSWIKG